MIIRFIPTLLILFACNVKPKEISVKSEESEAKPKSTVITQNLKHLKSEEELQINIQVEPLRDSLNPRIQIDGIDIPINPNGLAIYVTKVHGPESEHHIPIIVTRYYTNNKTIDENYTVDYFIDK